MAEVCRKGTLGSVLAWRAASLLLVRLLIVLKPPLWEREDKLQSEPVGAWLNKYTYSLLMEPFSGTWLQEYSTMPRVLEIRSNILSPIGYSVRNSNHVEFSKILRNILYPIEYSYDSTEVSTIYLIFSIAYLIYSTSQYPKVKGLLAQVTWWTISHCPYNTMLCCKPRWPNCKTKKQKQTKTNQNK